MAIIDLLQKHAPESLWRVAMMLLAATGTNILLLLVLPASMRLAVSELALMRYGIVYGLALILFLYALRRAGGEIVAAIREAVAAERLALNIRYGFDDNRHAEQLDQIEAGMAGLPRVTVAVEGMLTVVIVLVYIGFLSTTALAFAAGFLLLSGAFFFTYIDSTQESELRLRRRRQAVEAIRQSGEGTAEALETALAAETDAQIDRDYREMTLATGQVVGIFVLAAVMIFIAAPLSDLSHAETGMLLAAILFMAGPFGIMIDATPDAVRLERAASMLLDIAEEEG